MVKSNLFNREALSRLACPGSLHQMCTLSLPSSNNLASSDALPSFVINCCKVVIDGRRQLSKTDQEFGLAST